MSEHYFILTGLRAASRRKLGRRPPMARTSSSPQVVPNHALFNPYPPRTHRCGGPADARSSSQPGANSVRMASNAIPSGGHRPLCRITSLHTCVLCGCASMRCNATARSRSRARAFRWAAEHACAFYPSAHVCAHLVLVFPTIPQQYARLDASSVSRHHWWPRLFLRESCAFLK